MITVVNEFQMEMDGVDVYMSGPVFEPSTEPGVAEAYYSSKDDDGVPNVDTVTADI